ncbi:MAG: putative signal transducing protein [Terriglobia bacterium]
MEHKGESIRVWVGLNLLQAQMMRQVLLDSNIECWADRGMDMGIIPAGVIGEIGIWVSKADEAQARRLLEQVEEQMSSDLDGEFTDESLEPTN